MSSIIQRYREYLIETNLLSYSKVKGAYFLKENFLLVKKELEKKIFFFLKKYSEISIPILGAIEDLKKEKEHFLGFERELFEFGTFVLNPTSESILYPEISKEIQKTGKKEYFFFRKGLVFRKESKDTLPLIREREISFYEAHSFHQTEEQKNKELQALKKILKKLQRFFKNTFLLKKPQKEIFPGAKQSFSLELNLGFASLQLATVHDYGQNFSKIFKLQKNKNLYFQTTFGLSSRILGGLILENICLNSLPLPYVFSFFQVGIFIFEDSKEFFKKFLEELTKNFRTKFFFGTSAVELKKAYAFFEKSCFNLFFVLGKKEKTIKKIEIKTIFSLKFELDLLKNKRMQLLSFLKLVDKESLKRKKVFTITSCTCITPSCQQFSEREGVLYSLKQRLTRCTSCSKKMPFCSTLKKI